MASVDQPFSNQNEQDQNQIGSNSSANSSFGQSPQLTSGQGGTTTNSGGSTGGGFQGKGDLAGTQSGAYPNLQQYMSANQNWTNQQGQGLGGEIASNLGQQGQQIQQGTQNAQQAFQNTGNTWAENTQNAANAFNQGIAGGNAYNFTQNNPQAQQQAGQALNANYQGPQNLFGVNNNLQQQAQNYTNTAGQLGTESGRFNLLQQMFGGNNYNQGQQSLDQALLQTNPQQQQQLKGAQQQATQTQQNLQNANAGAQQQAQAWQNLGQNTSQQAAQNLNAAVNTENQNIQNQYQIAQQGQAANIAALQNGNISQALATQLGITAPIASTYGVNATQYLTQPALTMGNTAQQADYNQMAALQQLAGAAPTALTAGNSAALQQDQLAGTPGTSAGQETFNNPAYQAAIKQNQAAYNQAITPLVQALNQDKLAAYGLNGAANVTDATQQGIGMDTLSNISSFIPTMYRAPGANEGYGVVNPGEMNLLSQAEGAYKMYNPTQGMTITPNLSGMMTNS